MRWILIAAAILGASSVIIGAALKHAVVSAEIDTLQTALRYHQIHSAVLFALGLYALEKPKNKVIMICAALFILGINIFSGSLYLMVLYEMPDLGKLTPVGGISLILAWLSAAFISYKKEGMPLRWLVGLNLK